MADSEHLPKPYSPHLLFLATALHVSVGGILRLGAFAVSVTVS